MRQRLPPPPLPSPTPPRRPSPVTFCGFCWSSPSAFFDVDANFVWTTGAPFLLVLLHTLQLQLFFPLCWWRPTKQELLLESVFFVLLLLIEDFIYVVQRRLTKASSFFIDHDSFLLRSAGGGSLSDAVLLDDILPAVAVPLSSGPSASSCSVASSRSLQGTDVLDIAPSKTSCWLGGNCWFDGHRPH